MKYRIKLEINNLSKIDKLHQFLAKTHNFNKKFFTWVVTRKEYKIPVVRIKAIAISRDLEAELSWATSCSHFCAEEKIYEPHGYPRDWVMPEAMIELKALYPRREQLDVPWMNVFELNDFLEVDNIQRN